MAVRIAITSNQPQVAKLFRTLQQLGANLEPLLDDIAQEGENSTRRRFRDQVGPDGQRWKQSVRAQITGTKTLTKDGPLGNTITKSVDQHTAAWGTNRIYAAITSSAELSAPKVQPVCASRSPVSAGLPSAKSQLLRGRFSVFLLMISGTCWSWPASTSAH